MLLSVLLWLVALELIGLAALPITNRLLSALPDRGYASAKILGLVLISYLAWLTGILGLTGFTAATLVVIAVLLAAFGWWRWGHLVRETWRRERPLLLAAEATFLIVYFLAVWIRAFNSAIAGQEKQMDMTFLNSLILANSLPAPDLWLAGYAMPYYYLGYLMQAVVAKVTLVEPVVAYNLALASVLALAALGAFGLVAALVRLSGAVRWAAMAAGALGAFGLVIMGNLQAFFEVVAAQGIGDRAFWSMIGIKGLDGPTLGFPPADGGWWFRAARVIPNIQPDGITEFPYFSFLLGDLHPHYMAVPLGVLIATLAIQAVVSREPLLGAAGRAFGFKLPPSDEGDAAASRVDDWMRVGVTAIVLGAVIAFNTWDIPIFWGLFAVAVVLGGLGTPGFGWGALRDRIRDIAIVVVLAAAGYSPYFVGYVSQQLGVGITEERTYLGSLFVLFGPLLLLALGGGVLAALNISSDGSPDPAALSVASGRERRRRRTSAGNYLRFVQAGGVLLGAVLAAAREPTLGVLVAGLALWGPLAWSGAQENRNPALTAGALLTVFGLASILIPEIIFLRDSFQSRMNTVFKFYYDGWILLALAAPLVAWELVCATIGRPVAPIWVRGAAAMTLALTGFLVAAGAIYPIAATNTKSGGFAGTPTLDGLSYLRAARPDDVAVIEWLRREHPGVVIVEAVGNDYTDAARISSFAGVPTLLGWIGHELQWRGSTPELDRRQQLARQIYTDPDAVNWAELVDRLNVRFVVVGSMEREVYGPDVLSRLERSLEVVFRAGSSVVLAPRLRAQ